MRKLIFIILLLPFVAFGQTTYQLNYDSIRVGKTAGTGATSLYGKTYLKNATDGTASDSILTVRNGRIYKIAGSAISSVGFMNYIFSRDASDISGYEQMPALTSYVVGAADTATVTATIAETLIQEFATNSGFPNTTLIPAGKFTVHYETQKAAGSNNYYSYAKIYKRALDGTETLLATTDNSSTVSVNTLQQVTVSALLLADETLLTTDRIVTKVYARMSASTASISLYYDNGTDARLEFPAALVNATNFVPYNGATKDLVSAFSITGDSIKRVGGTGSQFLMGNGTVQDTTTIQTVANFFPKGDTRYAKGVGNAVLTTGNQNVGGIKIFTNSPVIAGGNALQIESGTTGNYVFLQSPVGMASSKTITYPDASGILALQGGNVNQSQVVGLQDSLNTREKLSNKATSFAVSNNTLYPTVQAVKTYADGLVVGLLNDRGSYDASTNLYPSTGGSGAGGAIMKGNLWSISVAGTLGGVAVGIGDWIRALTDSPGQTSSNWGVVEGNFGYVPENVANKATSLASPDNTKYPTTAAVSTALGGYLPTSGYTGSLSIVPSAFSIGNGSSVDANSLTLQSANSNALLRFKNAAGASIGSFYWDGTNMVADYSGGWKFLGPLTGTAAIFSAGVTAAELTATTSSNSVVNLFTTQNTSAGAAARNRSRFGNDASTVALTIDVYGSGVVGNSNYVRLTNQLNAPLILGANGGDNLTIAGSGAITLSSLAGTGTRMVVADNTGLMSTQAIPGGGGGSVTGVAVASANGLAGTSDGNAVVPTLTLTTTVNSPVLAGNGTAISAATTTGSGSTVVLATSPTLVTPTLGVAAATTINKVAITAPATGSTLTIADGKTLTASNSLILTGTDGSTLNVGTGGTLGSNAYTSTAFAPLASPALTGIPTAPTAAAGTNTTQIATTAYVDGAISSRTNRILKDWYTDANNVTTTETDLYSYTVLANTLVNNGDKLSFRISGKYAANANSKDIRIYFGLNSYLLSTTTSNGIWAMYGTIIKTGATTYRIDISNEIDAASYIYSYTNGTVTNYTGTNVFKITGQGVASADLTAQMGYLEFKPAAL